MNSLFTYFSPFEQFVITRVIPVNLFILAQQLHIMSLPAIDFTISNVTLILFLIFSIASLVIKVIKSPVNGTFFAMPISLESHFHLGYSAIQATLQKHVHVKYYQQVVFPITFALVIFLLLLNLAGVPTLVLLSIAYPSLNLLDSLDDLTDPGFIGHSSL